LLLLVGVAFHLAAGARESVSERMDITTIGGACIFVALLMRVGAPLAHVWVKDTIAHASPSGAAALSAFASMIGVYALARLYPAEPLLVPIGAGMIVVGALYAAAADDMRAAGAYALLTQMGVCIALIGVGSPLALAAAEGHAFTSIIAFAALQMALGAVLHRAGAARVSRFAGLSRAMPITCGLMLAAGLTAAAMPGLAMYASFSVGLEAAAGWDLRWLWLLFCAGSAALFVSLVLRPQFAAHRRANKATPLAEAPFPMVLGTVVAVFYCVSIGLAPAWLYALMPAELTFAPFAWDRMTPQLEMLGAAGVVYVLLHALRLAPREQPIRLLDVDALYRGPVAGAGRWAGVVLLRLYGAWRAGLSVLAERAAGMVAAWTRSCDRPYLGRGWAAVQFWLIGAVVVTILAGARL
jgi:multicomponent Na+:H+ antiporter subunit D